MTQPAGLAYAMRIIYNEDNDEEDDKRIMNNDL